MKKLILVLVGLVLFIAVLSANNLKTVRKYYFQVNTEEIELEDYERFVNTNTNDSSIEWQAYTIMTWFLKAKDYYNPVNKLEAFNKGRKLLDNLIKQDSSNLELRFLRYTIQDNAPGFLGYDDNIEEDKKFIQKGYLALTDIDLKTRIISYLKKD